jgi:hypothetical protein
MLVDFFAILVFAIIMILFLIIFIANKHQSTLNTENDFKDKDAAFMLDSFMRAPYLKDPSKSISDIISEDVLNDEFSRTQNSFSYYYSGINNYRTFDIYAISLCIKRSGSEIAHFNDMVDPSLGNSVTTAINACPEDNTDEYVYSKTTLPSIDGRNIDVYLAIRHSTKSTYDIGLQMGE